MNVNSDFVRGLIAGVVVFAAGWFFSGAAQRVVPRNPVDGADSTRRLVRAERIEIVDEAGTVLLALNGNDSGGAVSIRDRLGRTAMLADVRDGGGSMLLRHAERDQPAVHARATDAGGDLSLFNSSGRSVVRASVADDAGRFALAAPSGQTAVNLDVTDERCGRVRTTRRDGSTAVSIAHDAALGGLIETYSTNQHRLVGLSSTVGAHGRVDTYGPENDQPLVSLTATAEHDGQIYTYNADGRMLIAIASRPAGPTLRVFNAQGEPIVVLQSTEDNAGEIGVLDEEGGGRFVTP